MPQAGSALSRWLWLALVLLLLGSAIGLSLYFDYRQIDAQERERLATQAKVIDDNLGRQLLATNNALESIRADLPFLQAQKDGKDLVNQRLQAIVIEMPGLRTIVIMNAAGMAIASNRSELIGQDFHELERFQTVRRGDDPATLYVSPPFKTPLGVWAVGAGKMVPGARGEFAGVILTILDPEYFKVLLDSVRYAPDMWVSLAHADGKLFVMVPTRPGIEGVNLDQPGSFRNRHLASGQQATVMTGIVAATGEERMMAQRIIQPANVHMDKALAVGVARDLSSIFAVWRRDAYVRAGLFGALVLIAALGLYFYQRRQHAYDRLLLERDAERERATEALRESEERFRLAASTGHVWDWNIVTNQASFFGEFWRGLGYEAQNVGDQTAMLESLMHPDDRPRWRQAVKDHISQRLPYDLDFRARTKSGEYRWFNTKGQARWDEDGRATYMAGTTFDITERKQAEVAFQQLNAELEQRVAERTAELVVARERAEAADRVKSAFLATMSHELRTPLNSIIGFTGVLLQKLPGALNTEQEKQLGIVRNASRHLLALINDVLDISKVEAGELHLDDAPFDLRALLEQLGAMFAPQAGQHGLDFRLVIGAGEAIVTGDARRVEQVLNNLLSNALKFTPSGNITLDCRRQGDAYVITVADTGVGIKPEDMDKLFQPFIQIETGLPGVREGTGLGLAISMHLAQVMGGQIAAKSEWGQGSRFTFTLPTGDKA